MDKSEFDSYVKAGEIAKKVKEFAREIIKPGVKLIDIAEGIDAKILELGGEIAFPVNLGLNEVAAHFTPGNDCEEVANGILKIDLGICVNGFIADTAFSVDLSEDGRFKNMIELNRKVLDAASKVVRVGMRVGDVGEAVQDVMDDAGDDFVVIGGLCGHGLGENLIHTAPSIPNYRNDNDRVLDNMGFAIEPFLTSGDGEIFEGKGGGIYSLKDGGAVRDRDARKILEFVRERYGTRPFCARWLEREEFVKLRFALKTLVKLGIFYEYPMLIEKSRKPVSQIENTFVIFGNEVLCTTG